MKVRINPDTLPEATAPTLPGTNGLLRSNYFNGRYLTAEVMRRDRIYEDYRDRLIAEIHPSGIAWGLGLHASLPANEGWAPPPGSTSTTSNNLVNLFIPGNGGEQPPGNGAYLPKNGVNPAHLKLTLEPGLAFNGVGRPIVVGAPFQFDLSALIDEQRTSRFVVIDGGTQFAPCVCLAPALPGSSSGASISPGPYLLVIRATERDEGEAKVYGNVCGAAPGKLCEADAWRGGFALSLARFPVDVPMDGITSAWDLRGVLSAYYFDVYEHAIRERWRHPFPRAGHGLDFGDGLGPLDRQDGAIPLAMVYVGSDGSILFLDPWIPRRPTAATASAAWAANMRGAPTQAACIARVHQFQSQLDESLAGAAMTSTGGLNLYQRGFRHIPPWGFLPVPPPPRQSSTNGAGGAIVTDMVDVLAAEKAARAFFKGTNVIVYTVVAIHDDDILEDMIRAMEKDPVELAPCDDVDPAPIPGAYKESPITEILATIALALGCCGGITMDQLINRKIEIVKLVVPMRGRRRASPIVGTLAPNGSAYGVWGNLSSNGSAYSSGYQTFLNNVIGPAALPHEMVFYVKQRLVLLDVLYLILDAVLEYFAVLRAHLAADTQGTVAIPVGNTFSSLAKRDQSGMYLSTSQARLLAGDAPTKLAGIAPRVLDDSVARMTFIGVAQMAAPALLRPGLWSTYDVEQRRIQQALITNGTSITDAAAQSRDRAIDLLLREYQSFALVKLAYVLLPEADANAVVQTLRDEAATHGDANTRASLADVVFYPVSYEPVAGARGTTLFEAARAAYGTRNVSALDNRISASPDTKINDVLAQAPNEVSRLVGGISSSDLTALVQSQATQLTTAVSSLAASARFSDPTFWTAFDALVQAHNGDLGGVITDLTATTASGADSAVGQSLDQLRQVIGDQGLQSFISAARA